MSHGPEPHRPEVELHLGRDAFHRAVAVAIIAVAFLGAFTAWLEARAFTREAISDRSAKQAVVEMEAESSQSGRLDAVVQEALQDWSDNASALERRSSDEETTALVTAAEWTVQSLDEDENIRREIDATSSNEAFWTHEQTAKAFERERDGSTSQIARFATAITDFAIALLLLGIVAIVVPEPIRGYFLAVPSIGAVLTIAWALYISDHGGPKPNTDAITSYVRGRGYANRDCNQCARAEFTRAITLADTYEEAYLDRGRIYQSIGEGRAAAAGEARAPDHKMTPYQAVADRDHPELAEAVRADYEHSVDDLTRATELDPNDFSAWNDLAAAFWTLRNYESAYDAIGRAADLSPEQEAVSFNILEGLKASPPSSRSSYPEHLHAFEQHLEGIGWYAPAFLGDYIADVIDSGEADPKIASAMRDLCGDLDAFAMTLRWNTKRIRTVNGSYDCLKLTRTQFSLDWRDDP